MTHTTTPWQDFRKGIEGLATVLVCFALLIGVPIGGLWLIDETLKNYKQDKAQRTWIREHAVKIIEIKGRDTTFLCSDGIRYHLTPYLKGL